MTQAAPAVFKIPAESPQPARGKAARLAGRTAAGRVLANGTGRVATRCGEVIELEYGSRIAGSTGFRIWQGHDPDGRGSRKGQPISR